MRWSNALATQIWLVDAGTGSESGHLEVFKGTWRQWQLERSKTENEVETNAAEVKPSAAQEAWERQRTIRRLRRQTERQAQAVAETEARISRLESKMAEIEQSMAQASLAQEYSRLRALQEQHRAVSQRLESLMEEWGGDGGLMSLPADQFVS